MDETLSILVILMVVSHKRQGKNYNLNIENTEILEKRQEYLQLKNFFQILQILIYYFSQIIYLELAEMKKMFL